MATKFILEVIACSVDDAVAAQSGGADRLEIISHFELGGLTPPINLVQDVVSSVKIPVRVMIREIENFFVEDERIIERMCDRIRSFSSLCVDGLVLGFLKKNNGITAIDHDLLARLLSCAPGVKATFHRAFEELPDPVLSIGELKRYSQIDRILTSGGQQLEWPEKITVFREMEEAARPGIGILAGGGVDQEAVRLLIDSTPVREFHLGRAVRADNRIDGVVESDRVREFARLLKNKNGTK